MTWNPLKWGGGGHGLRGQRDLPFDRGPSPGGVAISSVGFEGMAPSLPRCTPRLYNFR